MIFPEIFVLSVLIIIMILTFIFIVTSIKLRNHEELWYHLDKFCIFMMIATSASALFCLLYEYPNARDGLMPFVSRLIGVGFVILDVFIFISYKALQSLARWSLILFCMVCIIFSTVFLFLGFSSLLLAISVLV